MRFLKKGKVREEQWVLKKRAAERLQDHIAWITRVRPLFFAKDYYRYFLGQWYACIDYLNNEDWTHLTPKFIDITQKLDQLRDEKCLEVFPELEPLFSVK